MSNYLGDFNAGQAVRTMFPTHAADGTPTTLTGTPVVSVHKDGDATQSTAGVTLTVDFDSRTGLNLVAVTTVTDGTFYSAGSDFSLVLTAGTVGLVSVVGAVIGQFSIENRSLTASRTEPTAVPSAAATMVDKLKWMFLLTRNKSVTDTTGSVIKADDGTTTVGTLTHNESAGVYTKNEWS